MKRVGLVASVLLLGASYLLFGAWWAAPEAEPAPSIDAPALRSGGPELAATAKRPVAPDESALARVAARHLLDELQQMDAKAQADLLGTRLRTMSEATVPFSEELVLHLVSLLASEDRRLAQHASVILRLMGPRVAPFLHPFLASDASEEKKSLALGLIWYWCRLGATVDLPPLLPLLDDATPTLRGMALRIAWRGVPYEEALAQRLLVLLRERPQDAMGGAGRALARMGPSGVALLVERVRNAETRERIAAFQGLRAAPAEHLKPHLALFAACIGEPDEDGSLRIAALHALAALGGDCVECLPALRQALSEESYDLAYPSFTVLAAMGPRAAGLVPDLLTWLEESDPRIVEQAATTLGAIRSRPDLVLPALETLLEVQPSDAAARALGAFGPAAYAHAVRLLDEGDEYARYAVLWTFATLGERAAAIVPRLIPLIDGDDPDISSRVVGTLGYLGPKARAAVPAIMARLAQGESVLSSKVAAYTLIRMGQPAEDALVAALRSGNETARRQALRVLTRFHVRTAFALDDLAALARAKDARIRADAIEAAGVAIVHPNDPGAAPPPARDPAILARVRAILEQGLKDADASVRDRAQYHLALIAMHR